MKIFGLLLLGFLFGVTVVPSTIAAADDAVSDPRPNIVLILADDLGYSDLGCYGGEIDTPNIDALAEGGVRFTQLYNSARCCPSRASLMTGLYPSQAGIGDFTTSRPSSTRGPGYLGRLNDKCVTLAEALKPAGYGCYYVGKWHMHEETGPILRGFDEFYGYTRGHSHDQYDAEYYIRLPEGRSKEFDPPQGEYYATDVFNDYALEFIQQGQDNGKPWLLFLGHSSPHFPVQAPADRADKYESTYLRGWDVLREERYARMQEIGLIDGPHWTFTPRSLVPVDRDDIANYFSGQPNPAWDSIEESRQRDLARRMAVFAAMVETVDVGVGRIINHLKQTDDFENTLILFLSDNGACYEWGPFGFDGTSRRGETTLHEGEDLRKIGGPDTHHSYGSAWANLGNTPFRLYKHFTHEGGISTPFIAHWPDGIGSPDRWERQPAHVMDVMPTILEATGASYLSEQNGNVVEPLEGMSLLPTMQGEESAERTIGFDHQAAHALRRGDWKIVWSKRMPHEIEWELYNLAEDRCETNDLADVHPERVASMVAEWEEWARRVGVIYEPENVPVESASPQIANRPLTITGRVQSTDDNGVIVAQGGVEQGYAVHLLNGKPAFDVRVNGIVSRIVSAKDAPDEFSFEAKLTQTTFSLSVDGENVAEGTSPGLIPVQPKDGMSIEFDDQSSAGNYESPNRLQGTVQNLEVLPGRRIREGAESESPHVGVEIQPAAFRREDDSSSEQTQPLPERISFQVLRDSENNVLTLADARLVKNILQLPTHGTLVSDDGRLSYAPNEGYIGNDSIAVMCEEGEIVQINIDVREHPNFVFILTDDQGWTSMSVSMDAAHPEYASDYHKTPHIDSLASEGMRFSRGYSPAPNCSPSRYANLTSKTCARLHFTDIVGRNDKQRPLGSFLLRPVAKATPCIQDDDITIPELLQTIPDAGYATAHFGKWHLGGNGPASHGFDISDGPTGNREGSQGPAINDDPKRAFSITQRACDFLAETTESGRPFYCQVSHYAVHAAIQHRASTLQEQQSREPGERHNDPAYAAMIADLDEAVGLLLAEIDRLGLRNSTYLVYQADNGCPQFLSTSAPLRRFKPETWDGGTRVPTFVRGPSVTAGSQCDEIMMGIDILPTVWDWAGGDASELPTDIDGGSLAPMIDAISSGTEPAEIERPGEVVAHSPHYILTPDLMKNQRPASVLHCGPWKLTAWYETGELLLFNLTDEISESTDVAPQYPVEYAQLRVRLRNYLKNVDAQMPTLDFQSFGLPAETDDVDQDGLPDAWELRELLTWKSGPDDDPDGDDRSNLVEFQQDTDPIVAD